MEAEPIFHAIANGKINVVRNFLSQGGDVETENSNGLTLLYWALMHYQTEIVSLLIDNGADVKSHNYMAPAMVYKKTKERLKVIKILALAGAELNISCLGEKDHSPAALDVAVRASDAELVKLLIELGASVNMKNHNIGWTTLHSAAANIASSDPTVFELLLSAGAEINGSTLIDYTPLQVLAAFKPKRSSVSLRKTVEIFLKYGARFDTVDNEKRTLLDIAITFSNTAAVKAFVMCGLVDVNSKFMPNLRNTSKGETILHESCKRADLQTVKFLLNAGANINALDEFCTSTLSKAINSVAAKHARGDDTKKEMRLLEYLLTWNPDVNTFTSDGENILTSSEIQRNDLPDYSWQTILKHLAKLRIMKSKISRSLKKTISNNLDYNNYFKKCKAELQAIKKIRLHYNSWVTLFNLLTDDIRKIARYAGNCHLAEAFAEERKFIEKSPIYGTLIRKRFTKACKTRKIWYRAATKLSRFFPSNIHLDHPAVTNILHFLNPKDFNKLCL